MEHRLTAVDTKRYRWIYEVRLLRNPVFFTLLLKIFFFIWLLITGMVLFISLVEGQSPDLIQAAILPMLFVGVIFLALLFFSYLLYSVIMRGKYTILFEMDDKGIAHIQVPVEAKKAEKLGLVTLIAGLATGQASVAGAGLLSAHRRASYTRFKAINKIRVNPKRQQIKIRSAGLFHNQIFTHPDDFDFVLAFIQSHSPEQTTSE